MNDKPNKPKYYRLLEKGEKLQDGDIWQTPDEPAGVGIVGIAPRNSSYFRPVQVDEWIEYSKQKPTKEDFQPTGHVAILPTGYPPQHVRESYFDHEFGDKIMFWRSVTLPQPAKPKSVEIILYDGEGHGRQPITLYADGHASVPCGSYFSAESINEFIKVRKEVMGKDL